MQEHHHLDRQRPQWRWKNMPHKTYAHELSEAEATGMVQQCHNLEAEAFHTWWDNEWHGTEWLGCEYRSELGDATAMANITATAAVSQLRRGCALRWCEVARKPECLSAWLGDRLRRCKARGVWRPTPNWITAPSERPSYGPSDRRRWWAGRKRRWLGP